MTASMTLTDRGIAALIALANDDHRRARPRNHGARLRKLYPISEIYSQGDLYEIAIDGRICAHLHLDGCVAAIEKNEDITTTAADLTAFLDEVMTAELSLTDVSDLALQRRDAFLREARLAARKRSDALFGAR